MFWKRFGRSVQAVVDKVVTSAREGISTRSCLLLLHDLRNTCVVSLIHSC